MNNFTDNAGLKMVKLNLIGMTNIMANQIHEKNKELAQLQLDNAKLREKVAFYDKWLTEGIYHTNLEYEIECSNNRKLFSKQANVIVHLQLDNEKLLECLERYCGDKCNAEYNPCEARKTLDALSTPIQEALGETK